MAQAVNERQAAALLAQSDRILILCHQKPDGDTLGSGFALLYALLAMGKTARIACPDGFPPRYCFLYPGFVPERQPDFTPSCIVAVDVADLQLLGAWAGRLAGKIDLCIDHHPSNTGYAARLLLDAKAAATVEIIDRVLRELGAQVDYRIAVCIYTGLATDTGCFRYSNTTPASHLLAARMMEHGIDSYRINKIKVSHEFAVNGLNFMGKKEHYGHEYNVKTGKIDATDGSTVLTNVSYKLEF